jgi:hypothetical protein
MPLFSPSTPTASYPNVLLFFDYYSSGRAGPPDQPCRIPKKVGGRPGGPTLPRGRRTKSESDGPLVLAVTMQRLSCFLCTGRGKRLFRANQLLVNNVAPDQGARAACPPCAGPARHDLTTQPGTAVPPGKPSHAVFLLLLRLHRCGLVPFVTFCSKTPRATPPDPHPRRHAHPSAA